VQGALASGILETERLESWRKLQREGEFLLGKIDPEIRRAEKKRIKGIMRQVKNEYKIRDKGRS